MDSPGGAHCSESSKRWFDSYNREPAAGDLAGRALLFLSSYGILFALLSLQLWGSVIGWVFGGLSALGVCWLLFMLVWTRRGSPDPYQVQEVHDRGTDVAGYVVAYLLPLVIEAEPTPTRLVAYLVFIAVVGIIYVRSDLVYVNPLLYVLQYRVFEVRTQEATHFLVARTRPLPQSTVLAAHMVGQGLLVREKDDDKGKGGA